MITDPRDGKVYRTVKIGNQVWMAENLNYDAPGSVCYNNDSANGEKYGRLYDWETAKKACPPGWHLPTNEEWDALSDFVGGRDTEGKHLKATSGWNNNGNGRDTYGFAALPGGNRHSNGSFHDAGDYGHWWSAGEHNSSNAYSKIIGSSDGGSGYCTDKNRLHSVRCLQD